MDCGHITIIDFTSKCQLSRCSSPPKKMWEITDIGMLTIFDPSQFWLCLKSPWYPQLDRGEKLDLQTQVDRQLKTAKRPSQAMKRKSSWPPSWHRWKCLTWAEHGTMHSQPFRLWLGDMGTWDPGWGWGDMGASTLFCLSIQSQPTSKSLYVILYWYDNVQWQDVMLRHLRCVIFVCYWGKLDMILVLLHLLTERSGCAGTSETDSQA